MPLTSLTSSSLQGDTPRQWAEKAQDTELAAYLEKNSWILMPFSAFVSFCFTSSTSAKRL